MEDNQMTKFKTFRLYIYCDSFFTMIRIRVVIFTSTKSTFSFEKKENKRLLQSLHNLILCIRVWIFFFFFLINNLLAYDEHLLEPLSNKSSFFFGKTKTLFLTL